MKKRFIFLTLILFLFSNLLFSATIHVPADYSSIQDAINASSDADTVLVANGTYYENNITLGGKEIVLLSESGPDNTIIDGQTNTRVFDCYQEETFNTEINGFTITNGQSDTGAAIRIYNNSYLTVRNCIITNNSAPGIWTRAVVAIGQPYNNGPYSPAGIYMYDCVLSNNSGYYGSAVFNGESGSTQSVFDNCRFLNNSGYHGPGIMGTRNSLIKRCVFAQNTATGPTNAVFQNEGGCPQIINCTFVNNNAYAVGRNSTTEITTIKNCIFWDNTGFLNMPESDSTMFDVSYSLVEDGFNGEGNIDDDPLFVDATNGDYHLQSGSPCIDAGNPDSQYNDPDGTRNDMGAFYYNQSISSVNYSLSFDGVNDYVQISDDGSFSSLSQITLQAYIKPDRVGASNTIIANWPGGNGTYLLTYYNGVGIYGQIQLNIGTSGGGWGTAFSLEAGDINKWVMIVATYNGSELNLYKNGQLESSVTANGQLNSGSNAIYIGMENNYGGIGYYSGLIDEVAIWNVALNYSEIQSRAFRILNPSQETGLISYWRFNEGLGYTTYDISGNNYNGTIDGATWSMDSPDLFGLITPSLLSPMNNTVTISTEPTFVWSSVDSATTYQLQVSTEENFSTINRDISGLADTTHSTSGLLHSIKYYWRVRAMNSTDSSTWSAPFNFTTKTIDALENDHNQLPKKFEISQNYPNPFNYSTKIMFAIPNSENVVVEVYNTRGQKIITLLNKKKNAGYHEIEFDGTMVSSGLYFCQIRAGQYHAIKKMILLK